MPGSATPASGATPSPSQSPSQSARPRAPFRLLVTDFDGTLKPFGEGVSPEDTLALSELAGLGVKRVVATGRSIETFERDRDPAFVIDYLISSSGLATSRYGPEGPGELLASRAFTADEARLAIGLAREAGYGFFLALPPPETHRFRWHPPAGVPPSCFSARIRYSGANASPWDGDEGLPVAQLLVMGEPGPMREVEAAFRKRAPGLSAVHSSSPYGDGALWLEIYPPGVSKGAAAEALAASLGLTAADAVAMGNDYNDEDLLKWAGRAFVSSEAPESLKSLYHNVPPAGQAPLAKVAGLLIPGFPRFGGEGTGPGLGGK